MASFMFVSSRFMVSFVVCVLVSLESNGVLRFRVRTSHGVLGCLCPDVPEVQLKHSCSWPGVSGCPALFVS